MSEAQDLNADALLHTVRDISRHIAGLADELAHLRHAHAQPDSDLVPRQINKIRDQISLLSAVVEDLAKTV